MIVKYSDYTKDKSEFFRKHNNDFSTYTSPMDEYGKYVKTYSFKDNSQWTEVMRPVHEKTKVTVNLVEITVDVKLFETEYWSTESGSKKYYEKF